MSRRDFCRRAELNPDIHTLLLSHPLASQHSSAPKHPCSPSPSPVGTPAYAPGVRGGIETHMQAGTANPVLAGKQQGPRHCCKGICPECSDPSPGSTGNTSPRKPAVTRPSKDEMEFSGQIGWVLCSIRGHTSSLQ